MDETGDEPRHKVYVLVNYALNAIKTHAQYVHSRAVRQTDEMMARAVEQITTARRVQVEEDAGHDNDLFFQTGLEEVETVGNGRGETFEVQPPKRERRH